MKMLENLYDQKNPRRDLIYSTLFSKYFLNVISIDA